MSQMEPIRTPHDPRLEPLCQFLDAHAAEVDQHQRWPASQLGRCAAAGVYRWFLPPKHGGLGWDEADLMRGYLRLGAACLTTSFVITQASGALRRIAESSDQVRDALLPDLIAGKRFATLGISHLTTSRRHLAQPALRAREVANGFRLDGFSPWVTGSVHADWIVTGAQLPNGQQLLAVLPTDLPGVSCDPTAKLVALSASHTGPVRLDQVLLERQWLLAGPETDVLQGATGAKTGGLQTSALAIGLASRAIGFVEEEAQQREDLAAVAENLRHQQRQREQELLALAAGRPLNSSEQLRAGANSLVLRATQAALTAAKGTGYLQGHPAGRWCREALFFLVWSCPQPVTAANLCELAGFESW
ncbi:MAG: acyl-CoA dehydrogenase [Planctomycetales bacterium]|nr:acyl-CoA dehydrogenase [Planctomycetales bacterium]NIM09593.1 acyl-CoA dehydrogenase [Planctomycetales bacterium]NIN09082.1 acyl-CoA dehydrogenase [Planctomycetales bacterium]NIN78192.1 acyl-CoA dehydrogenase [Planctomycetales bacterium]NIO35378.1 acyl-CoA dehydrogenase [Planctomycetales bacterium]